jgi:hypothetical protein
MRLRHKSSGDGGSGRRRSGLRGDWRATIQKCLIWIFGERWGRWLAAVICGLALLVGFLVMHWQGSKAIYSEGRSWIDASLPLPKAQPSEFTVVVAQLNDDDGNYQNLIVRDLAEVKWIRVLPIKRKIAVDNIHLQESLQADHAVARRYLGEMGAQILVWGTVLKGTSVSYPNSS